MSKGAQRLHEQSEGNNTQHLLTESQAAASSGLSVFQLRRRRADKKPPSYHKIDGKIFYDRQVMEDLKMVRSKAPMVTIYDGRLPDKNKIRGFSRW